MRYSLLPAVCVVLFGGNPSPLEADPGMREGHFFPDLYLPSLDDGKLQNISSFRGKKTLLMVFASW